MVNDSVIRAATGRWKAMAVREKAREGVAFRLSGAPERWANKKKEGGSHCSVARRIGRDICAEGEERRDEARRSGGEEI